MIKEDSLGATKKLEHSMKQTVSIWRTAKWGRRQEALVESRIKNKEEKIRVYPYSQTRLGEKEQGNECSTSRQHVRWSSKAFTGRLPKFQFADTAPGAGEAPS